jgi:hypothetical protein
MSFWFLNHELSDDELRWQLHEMKDKGFKGVFIHPRDGMQVPYQSERWWSKVQVIIDCCEELELHAWLYDEDPFPSGAAGGRVFVDRPEFKARELTMETIETDGGIVKSNFPMGRLVKVVAIRMYQDAFTRDWLDLTAHVGVLRSEWVPGYIHHNLYYPPYEDFGNPHWRSMTKMLHYGLDCRLPEGRWKICAFIEKEIVDDPWGNYTDLLNPQAVQYFLDLTHEKYMQRFGRHFGKLIPGIFTDEPKVKGVVSWTARFPDAFFSLFGYDILDRLPDLFLSIDHDTAQIRHDYRLALGRLFKESYVVPIFNWCEVRGMMSTGHISPEEDPIGQTRYVPYLLSMLKQFHLPGTDLIAGNIGSSTYPLLHLGPKLASSAAHHMDRMGVIAEAFGANSWEMSFKNMRKMADWLFVMGVTDIVTHGQFYSIDGLRKKEAPPSLFYQSSHWPFFLAFSAYLTDLSRLLKEGTHRCHVLVYYPQATFSAFYPDRIADLERSTTQFGTFLHRLLSNQWDFDLADEETLQTMTVKDGKLYGMKETYDVLLLAGCDYLESGTAACCTQFVSQGGNVWLVGDEPLLVKSVEWTDNPRDEVKLEGALYSKATDLKQLVTELERGVARETFVAEVGPSGATTIPLKDIYVQERKLAGKTRLFVMNAADDWKEGAVYNAPASVAHTWWRFVLPPHGSLMFDIDQEQIAFPLGGDTIALNEAAYKEAREMTGIEITYSEESIDLSGGWRLKPLAQNTLNLTHWHFWDQDPRLLHTSIASSPANQVLDGGGPYQDREGWAFSRFYTQGTVSETSLVFDRTAWEGECIIKVNGHIVPDAIEVRRYDVNNLEIDITSFIRPGDDRLALNWVEAYFPSGGRLLEPLRLFGHFRVEFPYTGMPPGKICYGTAPNLYRTLHSWDEIGFPHYAGTMIYEKEIDLSEDWLQAESGSGIYLCAESVYDVARLLVNDVETKTRYCDPFAWELTTILKPGRNKLQLEVANSPVALFEGTRKKSGLLGGVKLMNTTMGIHSTPIRNLDLPTIDLQGLF